MRRTHTRLTQAGICLMLAGTPMLAQRPAPGAPPTGNRPMPQMAGMPMMDCPMMTAMMHGPAAALQFGKALELTPAQRTKLEASKSQLDALAKPTMDSMRVIHAQLNALAQRPQLDERAMRDAFDRMGRVHTQMGLAMMRASHDANEILTPAQRDSLAAIAKRQMPKAGAMPMNGMMTGMAMCGAMTGAR